MSVVQLRAQITEPVQSTWLGVVPAGTPYLDPEKLDPENLPASVVAALGVVEAEAASVEPARPQSTAQKFAPPVVASARPVLADHVASKHRVTASDSPRAVVKAARGRIKELRAELRRMKALQKELAELERLVKAASEKPKQPVRALRSA